jgi:lysophospholipid acyltransferase (LPLAT)-like uncharacterized protein
MFRATREVMVRRILPPILLQVYRAAGATWKSVVHHPEIVQRVIDAGRPAAVGFLHARTFQLLNYCAALGAGRRWALICSQSRDGDAMAYVEQKLGFRVVRGSSGRGGVRALVALIKVLRQEPGTWVGMSIDGSRGPRGIAQAGPLMLAQKTGGVVLPLAASTRSCWVYTRSWDRLAIPRLFAEIHIDWGEPFEVPEGLSEPEMEALRVRLEESVLSLQTALDRRTGFQDSEPLRVDAPAEMMEEET